MTSMRLVILLSIRFGLWENFGATFSLQRDMRRHNRYNEQWKGRGLWSNDADGHEIFGLLLPCLCSRHGIVALCHSIADQPNPKVVLH